MRTVLFCFCFAFFLPFAFGQNLPFLTQQSAPAAADITGAQPCSSPTALACGQTLFNQTTVLQTNNFVNSSYSGCAPPGNQYNAPDKLYAFSLNQTTLVDISMEITGSANLNLFLLSSCQPASCIASSLGLTAFESVQMELDSGDYYVVVDGFMGASGSFSIQLNCGCTCTESENPGIMSVWDNFEQYADNDSVAAKSLRWNKWKNGVGDAVVKHDNTGNYVRVAKAGNYEADVWYNLGLRTSGRYRFSFRMLVEEGSSGRYRVLHKAPVANGTGANVACEVQFSPNDTAYLYLANEPFEYARFYYERGAWMDVMQIIDIDNLRAELWVNDRFIYAWYFRMGDPLYTGDLEALHFDAHTPGSAFRVDNFCFRRKNPSCTGGIAPVPVCIKNGKEYYNDISARCDLYTAEEMEPCVSVCDVGGTFIYRGDNFSGTFGPTDRAPHSLYKQPCVIDAYGSNADDIPPDLCAHIYVFSRQDEDVIGVNYDNNNVAEVKVFAFTCESDLNGNFGDCQPGEECWLDGQVDPDGGTNLDINNCSNFYYLVVAGPPGATYSNLSVIPTGECETDPDEITCGSTLSGTVSSTPNPDFTATTPAYQQCYNGALPYTGGEKFYKLKLAQPNKVTVKLTASGASYSRMGVFLYSFLCGENCIGYAENTASDPSGILTATLSEGIYYLVVDKSTNTGNSNFTIEVNCEQYSPFIDQNQFTGGNFSNCPTDAAVQHQVGIAYSPTYSPDDYFNFYFRNTDGKLKGNTEASQYWHNSTQPMYFTLNADQTGDAQKCSYAVGDTFYVFVHQTKDGKRTFRRYEPRYAPPTGGVTDSLTFQEDGFSLITKLTEVSAKTFGAETSFLRTDPGAKTLPLRFITNEPWVVEKVNGTANWLTINPTQSPGGEVLSLTFSENTSVLPNSVVLRFYSTQYPGLYRQFVTVEQQGQCIVPQQVDIVPGAGAVCAGSPVTLSANVGAAYQDLYHYKWSTGETTPSITVMPPAGTSNYSVTVTNKYCFITSSATLSVSATPLPAPPQNPVGATMCLGGPVTALSVAQPPGGQHIDWYDQAAGGQLLQSGTATFSPPPPASAGTFTYFAETKLTAAPNCASTSRTPVTLTVFTPPQIMTVDTVCNPNLLTYKITATVANAITLNTQPAYPVLFSNGTYIIDNIPKGTDLTLIAVNANCTVEKQVESPQCNCPAVETPDSGGDKEYCAGDNPPTLVVAVNQGETADWYNQMTGGDFLGTGFTFTPAGPGTYWVQARNQTNNCSSERIPINLTINALPTFFVLETACSDDLTQYSVRFSSDAKMATAFPHVVQELGGGIFEITGIATGSPVSIRLTDLDTQCERDTVVQSPLCGCPQMDKPSNPLSVSVCEGTSPVPPLAVSVGPGLTANWYRNGQLQLGSPALSFAAAAAGTYFAKTFNPVNGCESEDSTAVTLEIKPLPALSEGAKQCDPSWQTYEVTVASSTAALSSNPSIVPVPNGNGTYTFSGISIGSQLVVTATANGCSSAITVEPPVCSCSSLPPAPGNPNNPAICLGDAIPFLTVSVSNPSAETVDWYDAPAGGTKVGGNTLQYKPDFAFVTDTFYAQAKLVQFPNCVSPRTPVVLRVDQPAVADAGEDADICAGKTFELAGIIQGSAVNGTWTDALLGGMFIPNETYISAQKYKPATDDSAVTLILTAFPPATSACKAVSDSMLLTVRPLPSVTVIHIDCEPDLTGYFIQFSTDANQLIFTPDVGVLSNSGGVYTYNGIPKGQTISIKAAFSMSGCDITLFPPALSCPCPTDIAAPQFLDNGKICKDSTAYPKLKVSVPVGMTVDWYDVPFGGTKLDSNTVEFLPLAPDVPYYAETRDLLTGCTSQQRQQVVLQEAPNPNADAGADREACPGTAVILSAEAGAGYMYEWSTGQGSQTIEVLAQNAVYYLTVTLGICSARDTVAVSLLPAVQAGIALVSEIKCHGGNDGALSASASGGSPGIVEYAWSNGAAGSNIANLPAATYTVTATDAKGCRDVETYVLGEPTAIVLLDTTIMDATDNQNNGSVLAMISGGVLPYQYQWLLPNGNPISGQTDSLLKGVFAGNYRLQVTDANGCVFLSGSFTVDNIIPAHEPGLSARVSIFPNPTTGKLYLRFDLPVRMESAVGLYDVLGRKVLSARPGAVQTDLLEFDLSDAASGLYLLKINLEGLLVNKIISIKR